MEGAEITVLMKLIYLIPFKAGAVDLHIKIKLSLYFNYCIFPRDVCTSFPLNEYKVFLPITYPLHL